MDLVALVISTLLLCAAGVRASTIALVRFHPSQHSNSPMQHAKAEASGLANGARREILVSRLKQRHLARRAR